MADRFPLILNTSANQIQEIGSGDQLDLTGNNIANAGIITAGNVTIGAATTDLVVTGDARITGILTIGTSSLKLDGPNNLVNVGTALTLGHTQGLQFHTQNLHSAGFEVNQINSSGVVTATTFKGDGDFVELDVDGHTNLDNVSVAGVSTFSNAVKLEGGTANLEVGGNTGITIKGANPKIIFTDTDHNPDFSIRGNGGQLRIVSDTTLSERLIVDANGNFDIIKNVDVRGDLDVNGHTNLDNVSIAGVTTFAGASFINNILTVKGAESTHGIFELHADEGDDNADMWRLRSATNGNFFIDHYATGSWEGAFRASPTSCFLYYENNHKMYTTATGIHVQNNVSGDTSKIQVQKASGDAEVVCQRTGGSGIRLRGSHPQSFIETTTDSDLRIRRNTNTRITLGSSGNTIAGDTTFQSGITGTTATFSGDVSIGGELTYEDVTNVDSVGVVTARSGLVSPNADIDDFVSVGSNIHLGNAGVVTATSFVGSGAALTGIDATSIKDSGGNIKVQAQASGAVHSGISTFNEINLGDSTGSGNNRLKFGVGNEFQIYHNSVHTMIENSTGSLWIKSTHAGHIYLYTGSSHGIYLEGDDGHVYPSSDSAIDIGSNSVRFRNVYADTLYGDGSNLTGISQVGGATSVRFNDDVKAFFGTSSSTDCEIVRNSNAVAGQDSLTVKSDLPFIVSTNNLSNIQFYVNNNSGNNGLIFDNNGLKPSSNNNVKLGSSSYKYSSLYAVNVFATTLFGDGSNLTGIVISSDAQYNTVAGTNAGDSFSGTNAEKNTLFGYDAGTNITTADQNTAFGYNALKNCNSASNTAVGQMAGQNISSGDYNTVIGDYANAYTNTGSNNVTIGAFANTYNTSGSSNVAIGRDALYGCSTSENVGVGEKAFMSSTGANNTGVGAYVGQNVTSGGQNTFLGKRAGDLCTQGSNNIVIGANADPSSATVSNEVTIGDANITKFRIPGINVTLKDNGGTPTQGHVLTVDGNGEAGFAAVSGVSVANQSNNRLITCSGSTDALNSEANLTYDAVTLKNIISVSGSVPDLLEFRNSASTWGGGFRFGTNNSYGAFYITNNDKSTTVGLFNSTGGWNWGSNLRLHGSLTPNANNTYDIGSSSLRWRNIYTNDINLSNEGGANDVDGTWGNYTIQEGESDLFLINKRNGKKYKFNLTEIS